MEIYRSNSLNIEEQESLLKACPSFEDEVLFSLALYGALRRADVAGIETANIDLKAKTLKFWEQKKRRYWTIPIHDNLLHSLEKYLNLRKGQRYLFNFCDKTAYNKLQRALKRAGITKLISFHDLRRSFVKTAKKRGISRGAVAQITGDSIRVIERYYENLDMDELQDEVNKL